MLYRKKPEIVHAIHWNNDPKTFNKIVRMGARRVDLIIDTRQLNISTSVWDFKANLGDWIVRGEEGAIYPVRPDVFERDYEKIN